MKFIHQIFEKNRKHFERDGKLKALYPLFEAFETLFFIPGERTFNKPFVRDNLDLKRFMSFVIIALTPHFLFGVYNTGYQSLLAQNIPYDFWMVIWTGLKAVLPLVMVSYTIGMFWEVVFASIRKHEISEGFLVTGLLFPLILPPTVPLWQAAVGISFGVIIGKEIFGGTGRNILNPALTARAFLFFAYPGKMSGDSVWAVVLESKAHTVDMISGATPLAISSLTPSNQSIEATLHNAGFTFSNLFFGLYPGSIGETSALLAIVGALFLAIIGIASYRIILGGVLGVLITGFFLNAFVASSSNPWLSLNPFYHLVMGGFAFGIAYMATDPVTAPGMEKAKWIYGFLIGFLTVIIRAFNPAYAEGVMLAILFMNLFSPLLDQVFIRVSIAKRIPNV